MRRDDGLLCCDAGHERYAFRCRDVHHVQRAEHLRPDAAADGRIGVLTLGEHAVPVFALTAALGRPFDRSAKSFDGHIAVTGDRDTRVGWLVDRIVRAGQPGPDDFAPLPSIVGAPATTWFEGIVKVGGDSSSLLLAPQGLNPMATAPPRAAEAVTAPVASSQPAPEPVAVVFSTTVLPATPALRYALSGRQIAAIVQPRPPLAVPGCGRHVLGIGWWRRAIVPVIDFRRPADRSTDPHRRRLIAQCGGRHRGALVAFSIDAEVLMCKPDAAHRRLPDVPCPSFVSGIYDVNGDAVALLDLDALLDAGLPLGDRDAVLPDLLVERAARDAEPLGGPADAPAFGR